ncbi:MAG TPA: hypothetical protein VE441_04680 [Mycobacterium sp.]|jgi:hypothetical protein|nr:hypothetical protein [Mycobacterium sp.]
MNTTPPNHPTRILVVGRSPSVLVDTVDILRAKGYTANATNQFDRVVDDYDAENLDMVVFGGMVPPDTKEHLRQEIGGRNPQVTFVQGLAGMAGLIAAQIEGVLSSSEPDDTDLVYDTGQRTVHLTLHQPAQVRVEAWWGTSFTPPEPKSTSLVVQDATLNAGSHSIPLPAEIPSVASFIAVTVGAAVRTFTVGPMPQSVLNLVPGAGNGAGAGPTPSSPLSPVREVNTGAHER